MIMDGLMMDSILGFLGPGSRAYLHLDLWTSWTRQNAVGPYDYDFDYDYD